MPDWHPWPQGQQVLRAATSQPLPRSSQTQNDLGRTVDYQFVGLLHKPKTMGTPDVLIDCQSVGLLHRPKTMGTPGVWSDLMLAPAQIKYK